MQDKDTHRTETSPEDNGLPVIPLRNIVVMPHSTRTLMIGRPRSLKAVEYARAGSDLVFCVAQKNNIESDDDPNAADMYRVGTICRVMQLFRLPDGSFRLLVQGEARAKVTRYRRQDDILFAYVEPTLLQEPNQEGKVLTAQKRTLQKLLFEYVELHENLPEAAANSLRSLSDAVEIVWWGMANIELNYKIKQKLLEQDDLESLLEKLLINVAKEVELLKLESRIDSQVKSKLSKLQREYYLHEQLKIIQKELGMGDQEEDDIIKFKQRLEKTNLNEEARQRADEELNRLSHISRHSQEYGVSYNYLNWLLDMPWDDPKRLEFDLNQAQQVLDEDHWGLNKVKDRILEFLAVMKITDRVRGQILCFVGPPGVGKTSLGKSIARSIGRKFVRLSLGGVRDEAEIRGHRRTYIGALPGVIMQSMKKAETRNPLIMMDEIDKMSVDFRGDPSAALLEVLDPEQNHQFRDHYLDFGYDLSDVLFITTANTLSSIPPALLDRMEIIEIPGYTELEKLNIASRHLIPRTLDDHEVDGKIKIEFPDETIAGIIRRYTRESGVRELERKIATITRKIIKQWVAGSIKRSKKVKMADLRPFLGVEKHLFSEINKEDRIGVVTGLAWTATGGETLQIEVVSLPGDGKLKLTGKLGDVMKESAEAAYSLARLYAKDYGYNSDFYKTTDLHLHIPEGAIPKDGPSAGVTMVTALISALSNRKVNHNIAMTGEISLTGQVLPIGGLIEKLIAARRAGVKTVLIPELNAANLEEVPKEVLDGLKVLTVKHVSQVLEQALQ